jgi:O-antigen ligase
MLSPYGPTLVEYLPFVGNVESENVDYRVRLWQVSMEVVRQNPLFGDAKYMMNPILEQLRLGHGIIDIVNSYLQVLMEHGIVGLGLFILPFLSALLAARNLQRAGIANGDPHIERLGRALLATLLSIMVVIATVSSINTIPTMYWIVVGLCVGTTRAFYSEARSGQPRTYKDRYSRLDNAGTGTAG